MKAGEVDFDNDAPLGVCKHGPIEWTDEDAPYCPDCDHELAIENAPVGWIVLTEGNGTWRDDWDGDVHKDRDDALVELAKAKAFCGDGAARLVRLAWDDEDDA